MTRTVQVRFLKNEEGATAPEYALMTALITAVIAATVTSIGASLNTLFTTASAMFGAAS